MKTSILAVAIAIVGFTSCSERQPDHDSSLGTAPNITTPAPAVEPSQATAMPGTPVIAPGTQSVATPLPQAIANPGKPACRQRAKSGTRTTESSLRYCRRCALKLTANKTCNHHHNYNYGHGYSNVKSDGNTGSGNIENHYRTGHEPTTRRAKPPVRYRGWSATEFAGYKTRNT